MSDGEHRVEFGNVEMYLLDKRIYFQTDVEGFRFMADEWQLKDLIRCLETIRSTRNSAGGSVSGTEKSDT